jgi:hypothetical protein
VNGPHLLKAARVNGQLCTNRRVETLFPKFLLFLTFSGPKKRLTGVLLNIKCVQHGGVEYRNIYLRKDESGFAHMTIREPLRAFA